LRKCNNLAKKIEKIFVDFAPYPKWGKFTERSAVPCEIIAG
jgi:hypothetical protein